MKSIEISGLTKYYRLGQISTGTVSHDLNRWWAIMRGKDDPYTKVGIVNRRAAKNEVKGAVVKALDNINLSFEKGEVIGIIGKNGAGKSTLLKILSRVTSPSRGSIRIRGRLAGLLEVGTGFHPEMTGRENIYMNGTIMGMAKKEIDKKLDQIVDFSGVANYLDTPIKRYSSGMTVRLGFSVAAFLDPDILIIDEVLAVGDAEFQRQAINKMRSINESDGRTIILVSHNLDSIKSVCRKGVVISDGKVSHLGEISECIGVYMNEITSGSRPTVLRNDNSVAVIDSGTNIERNQKNAKVTFHVELDVKKKYKRIGFSIHIYNHSRTLICILTTVDSVMEAAEGRHKLELSCDVSSLMPGTYFGAFRVIEGRANFANLRVEDLFQFQIERNTEADNFIHNSAVLHPEYTFQFQ